MNLKLIFILFLSFKLIGNNLKVSYSILTHNETKTLDELLDFLLKNKDLEDEIILVDDFSNNNETLDILDKASKKGVKIYKKKLNFDFAEQRNYAKSLCTGNYIFTIDADETPSLFLIQNLKKILQSKSEGYLVPRIHIIDGFGKDHPGVNEKGWYAWPDNQLRIYKNTELIRWVNPVHESVYYCKTIEKLPENENYALTERKPASAWNISGPLYMQCYKHWLIKCLNIKDFTQIESILKIHNFSYVKFFLEPELLAFFIKEKQTKIINHLNKTLAKTAINLSDVDFLINLLKKG